jgi:AAA+ ATPase superfamily predicted ATPase
MQKNWGFYGRDREIADIRAILDRGRWFFCAVSGRRRIGKTSLIREALQAAGERRFLYIQIPDSDERGVVQAFQDALESQGMPPDGVQKFRTFSDMANAIAALNASGTIVILDEFQYFHRKVLSPFQSLLQDRVDRLRDTDKGGLIVLGSIHTEMSAILEDRTAPLFNRITDRIEIGHWDFTTLFQMFDAHGIVDPGQQLFLWTLFEGVPKFYRDAFDQGVLVPSPTYRSDTLRRLFFEGSSPLRDEADNWFLREFRGRYDTVLKLLARFGPCSHGALMDEFSRAGAETDTQLGGYLKILIEKYRMVECQRPIFATKKSRKTRYALTDNFLTAWLGALKRNVDAARIMPLERPLAAADADLATIEGVAFERMVRGLTVECSRKGVGDFVLSEMIQGYWDSADTEIDLIAIDNLINGLVRFGSCKRSAAKHTVQELMEFDGHVDRFINTHGGSRVRNLTLQKALYAPFFPEEQRHLLSAAGYVCRDLVDFRHFLLPAKE